MAVLKDKKVLPVFIGGGVLAILGIIFGIWYYFSESTTENLYDEMIESKNKVKDILSNRTLYLLSKVLDDNFSKIYETGNKNQWVLTKEWKEIDDEICGLSYENFFITFYYLTCYGNYMERTLIEEMSDGKPGITLVQERYVHYLVFKFYLLEYFASYAQVTSAKLTEKILADLDEEEKQVLTNYKLNIESLLKQLDNTKGCFKGFKNIPKVFVKGLDEEYKLLSEIF